MGFVQTQNQNVVGDPEIERQQQEFANALKAQTQGQGPSAAGLMLQQAQDRNLAASNAMIAGRRGISPGLALRNAQMAQSQGNQQAAGQAALARTQEQLGAQGMYGANLSQQMAQKLQAQQANQGADVQRYGIREGVNVSNNQTTANVIGGLASGVGMAALAASDERVKKDIHNGDRAAYEFLDALSAHKFRYKDPHGAGAAPGEQLGVMAQDLERTPAGDQMVENTSHGKMIDPARGIGAVLAAQADLHDRLKALEGGSKPKKMAQGGPVNADPTSYLANMPHNLNPMRVPDFSKFRRGGGGDVAGYSMPEIGSQYSTPGPSLGDTNLSQETIGAPVAAPGPSLGSYNYGKPAFSKGGKVSGKSKVKGDSESNDTVHAMLSPGEIVVPRSQATDAEKAKEFIDHVMKTKRGKNASGSTYTRVLAAHRELGDALKALNKKGA